MARINKLPEINCSDIILSYIMNASLQKLSTPAKEEINMDSFEMLCLQLLIIFVLSIFMPKIF